MNLHDKRARVWAQMQEIRDTVDADGWTAELRESWDKADADITTLGEDIARQERASGLDELEVRDDRPGPDSHIERDDPADKEIAYRDAFNAMLRSGVNEVSPEQRSLLAANYRAASTTTTAGGYTIPQGFWAKVTETLKFYGGVQANAENLNTAAGNDLPWPTNDDTANSASIVAENTQIADADLTFGQKTLHAFVYPSGVFRVSFQLLQDTGIDLESFIAKKIGERIGRKLNAHFTTGTGSGQPQGLITGATAGVTGVSTSSVQYDDLVDLVHSVDVAYRQINPKFMCHDLTLGSIRKIKDTQGHPLWQPAIAEGRPDTLLGYPVVVNNDMATLATGVKSVAFGSIETAYVVRTVNPGQLIRLEERYADYLQVGFIGFARADGIVQDAAAVKYLTNA